MYTADKRIYLNGPIADPHSQVVAEDDPSAAVLLVAEGGTLTDEVAARFGLEGSQAQANQQAQDAQAPAAGAVLSSQSIQPAEANSPVGGDTAGTGGSSIQGLQQPGETVTPLNVSPPPKGKAK